MVSRLLRAQWKASLDSLSLNLETIAAKFVPACDLGAMASAHRIMRFVVQLTSLCNLTLRNGDKAPLLQQELVSRLPAYPSVASKLTSLSLDHPTHMALARALPALTCLTSLTVANEAPYDHAGYHTVRGVYCYILSRMLEALAEPPLASNLRVLHLAVHITYGRSVTRLNSALMALTGLEDLSLTLKTVDGARPHPEIRFGSRRIHKLRLMCEFIHVTPDSPSFYSADLVQSIRATAPSITNLRLKDVGLGPSLGDLQSVFTPMTRLRILSLHGIPFSNDQLDYLLFDCIRRLHTFALTRMGNVNWFELAFIPAPDPQGAQQQPPPAGAGPVASSLRRLWLRIGSAEALQAILHAHPGVTDLTLNDAILSEGCLSNDLAQALAYVPCLRRLTLQNNDLSVHEEVDVFCTQLRVMKELRFLSITGHSLIKRQKGEIRAALADRPNFAGRMRLRFADPLV